MIRRLLLLLAMCLAVPAHADPVTVNNLRLWPAPDHTRLVFDLSGPIDHHLFTLTNPDRLVVDLDNARLKAALPTVDAAGPLVTAIRTGIHPDGLRFVVDLKAPVHPRSFVLKPYDQYGYRLVVDLFDARQVVAQPPPVTAPSVHRDLIVAIDPGHGGDDPGATGRVYHTHEKDVVLAIGRDLAKLVNATPGMRAIMTRKGDYYVPLTERTRIALAANADVFISIHADSVRSRFGGRGSSVYAVSDRGANSALAKALADDENAADWIGGVSSDEIDQDVRDVLGDLTKTATIDDSLALGKDMLHALHKVGPLHSDAVGQAGFVVLKSPIPSVLIETAFISNPSEERKLRNPAYQERLAHGIYNGLLRAEPRLLARRAPAPVQAAASVTAPPIEHVVRRGETLAEIAHKYKVDVDVLRFANGVHGNRVPVGARLRIPIGGT